MTRTPSDVVAWLLERSLLRPADLVHGDLAVEDVSRLHTNYAIWLRGKPHFFVKVCSSQGHRDALIKECAAYALLERRHATSPREWLVRPVAMDEHEALLVLPHLGGTSLATMWTRPEFEAVRTGTCVGSAVRELHEGTPEGQDRSPMPWVFDVPCPELGFVTGLSGAGLHLTRIAQRSQSLMACIQDASAAWERSSTIHGDLRPDNIVVDTGSQAPPALVDWEAFGAGDPAWDLACFLGRLISSWTAQVRPVDSSPQAFDVAATKAEDELTAMRALSQSVLVGYGLDGIALRDRVLEYVPAVLLSSAYETCQYEPRLPRGAVILVQLAENLASTGGAAAALLGIRVP